MLTRIRPSTSDEQGFTLIELLVVMVITLVIGSIVLTSFVTSGRATIAATNRIDGINDLTPAMQRLTRDLRSAAPLVIDSTGQYANRVGTEFVRNGVRYRTFYYVDPATQELYADRFTVNADGTTTVIGTSDLVTDISNGATPVFTYFTTEDVPIICTGTTAACRDEHLTAAKVGIELVRAVEGQQPIEYRTVIGVRNTRYGT